MSNILFECTLNNSFIIKGYRKVTVYDDHVVQEEWHSFSKKRLNFSQDFREIVSVKPYYNSEYVPGTFLELVKEQPEPMTKYFPYQVPYMIPYGIKAQKDAEILFQHLTRAIEQFHMEKEA